VLALPSAATCLSDIVLCGSCSEVRLGVGPPLRPCCAIDSRQPTKELAHLPANRSRHWLSINRADCGTESFFSATGLQVVSKRLLGKKRIDRSNLQGPTKQSPVTGGVSTLGQFPTGRGTATEVCGGATSATSGRFYGQTTPVTQRDPAAAHKH
jgi:hypothetical protein